MMRSRRAKVLIAGGVIVFLAISAVLARWLSLENLERDDVLTVIRAEARGDVAAMLSQLSGCERRCRENVAIDARRLKRRGSVQILAYQSQTSYSLFSSTGDTRVAWKSSLGVLPVVQCVKVVRKGNVISGLTVTLASVSLQIPDTADC